MDLGQGGPVKTLLPDHNLPKADTIDSRQAYPGLTYCNETGSVLIGLHWRTYNTHFIRSKDLCYFIGCGFVIQ